MPGSESAAKVVIYSCIAGGYDRLRPPRFADPSIDYVCFTDAAGDRADGWDLRPVPRRFADPAMTNRYAKMHPHLLFPDHDASIYVDGNIEVVGSTARLRDLALNKGDIALYQHPFRTCIYEEADQCALVGHDWNWRIQAQMMRYRASGFPGNAGLFECNVIVRRHMRQDVRSLMEVWWEEFSRGVRRDQLSLMYLAWKAKIAPTSLGWSDPRFGKTLFDRHDGHEKPTTVLSRLRAALNWRILSWQARRDLSGSHKPSESR